MRLAVLAAVVVWASGAGAAELPSHALKAQPPEGKTRECWIGNERGVEATGGLCVRVSGYVTVGVGAAPLRH